MSSRRTQTGFGSGAGIIIAIIIIAGLVVGYSFIKTGTPMGGISSFINYVQQDPIAAAVLFIGGIVLGKIAFRSYM